MYSSSFTPEDLRDCRRYARAVISASFISSLRHVQTLRRMDDSIETMRQKMMSRPKVSNSIETMTTSTAKTTPRVKIIVPKPSSTEKQKPIRPKNWSPIVDGRKAISAMIDQIWCIPYAPCRYFVQFICTVSLCALQRHKYCVRWQNGRRSAMFYVKIDETDSSTSVWVNFPGETKALLPQYSVNHFHLFLQRNLF